MFGDGQDYDWAMEGEDGEYQDEEEEKKDLRLEDVSDLENLSSDALIARSLILQKSRRDAYKMKIKPSRKPTVPSGINSSTPPSQTTPFSHRLLFSLHPLSPPVGRTTRSRNGRNTSSAACSKRALGLLLPRRIPTQPHADLT